MSAQGTFEKLGNGKKTKRPVFVRGKYANRVFLLLVLADDVGGNIRGSADPAISTLEMIPYKCTNLSLNAEGNMTSITFCITCLGTRGCVSRPCVSQNRPKRSSLPIKPMQFSAPRDSRQTSGIAIRVPEPLLKQRFVSGTDCVML